MKKYLIDFWFFDSFTSKESRKANIISGYRPSMYLHEELGTNKNKSTPIHLINQEFIEPGFKGIVSIESDFELENDTLVFFKEGKRLVAQGIVLTEIDDLTLNKLKSYEIIDVIQLENKDTFNEEYFKDLEKLKSYKVKVINCYCLENELNNAIVLFITSSDTNYKEMMKLLLNDYSCDSFTEVIENLFVFE